MTVSTDSRSTDPRSPTSSVHDVVEALVAAIRTGRLAPGQRLGEIDFAKRLGVARTTIREAFQRLEVEGLLSQERHRGFMVRVINRKELQDIYEARAALDGLAARLAAPRVKQDGRELDRIYQELEQSHDASDMKNFTRLNGEFHEGIRRISGNDLIARMLQRLEQSVYHYQFRLLIDSSLVFQTQDDHRKIYQALKAGDGPSAELHVRDHSMNSLNQLLQLPDKMFGML
jgi:DNA-binding GntR family transcriptional regulator